MELAALGRTPIPGPNPAGQDARYDPDYAQLQAEIDKLTSVTRAGEVEWKRVVDLAAGILSLKAKDLLAAAYMSVGLMQTQGLAGLATGTQVLGDLVATYWEDGFPSKTRLRGRMNAFYWWQEKTVAWVKAQPASDLVPIALHTEVIAGIKVLDQVLGGLLPDLASMRELLNHLERMPVEKAPEPEIAAEPGQAGSTESSRRQEASVGQAPSAALSSAAAKPPEDSKTARNALIEAAMAFAGLVRAENPADPWAWKASRLAAWINIKGLPPAVGGQTMIPAPDAAVKAGFSTLLAEGKLLEAANAAEEYFTGAIFWLDLQCIIAKALAGLGDDYTPALDAVRGEVRQFVKRLPGLEQLSFADGTPFVDSESRVWLASLINGQKNGKQQACPEPDQSITKILAQAEAHFSKKDEAGALDLISQAMLNATDGPVRLRLRLGQMELLCRSNRFAMAAALAEELLAEIDARGLENWAPALVVDVLLVSREVFAGLGGETNLAKARVMAAKISRIRPSAALNLAM
ncbi:MAG: type VI secretion system protein TssA [Pseudomonadota bacterium]